MKSFLASFMVMISVSTLSGQSEKYVQAMQQNLEKMAIAKSVEDWQQVANLFERISAAEEKEWLPIYYQSFCHMMLATQQMQEKEMESCMKHLDQAQAALDQAQTKTEEPQSEILALQGFIYQGRIWENFQANGPIYSPKSHEALDKAIALDPENPRSYYLKGQNVLHTPVFFGGGGTAALPLLEKAAEKFASFESKSPLHPSWGQGQNEYMLARAKKMAEAEKKGK